MPTISNEINNVIYVEPNFNYSQSEYDVSGLNTYEFTPPTEDYCIYANLEVEFTGRKIVASNTEEPTKITASWYSSNGSTQTNFMQGTTMPDGTNYFTSNYTDTFLGDIKKNGASTEMFGIKNIDIEYAGGMQAIVTIDFVDIRGVSLFSQKEYYETLKANGDAAVGDNSENVADTFFSSFFKTPPPRFTLYVKGFYGQPVSYQLLCSDFRARFESSTGSFNCTAKFVGYHFAFMNDAMMNIIMPAPYSDYIGADYWTAKGFTLQGSMGGKVAMPKFASLVKQLKNAKAQADKLAASSPEVQEKETLDEKQKALVEIRNAYAAYMNQATNAINAKVPNNTGLEYIIHDDNKNGDWKRCAIFNNNANNVRISEWTNNSGINELYNAFKEKLESFNGEYSDSSLPTPPNIGEDVPQSASRVDRSQAYWKIGACDDIKEASHELYQNLQNAISNANVAGGANKYGDYYLIYYYDDKGFSDKLDEELAFNDAESRKANEAVDGLTNKLITDALGWIPSVENLTRIVMAHFETYAYMLHKCGIDIANEGRTASSLGMVPDDLSDVNLALTNEIVPPFPLVTEIKEVEGQRRRAESWVGNYSGYFREKDLVNGLVNAMKSLQDELAKIEKETAGEETAGNVSNAPLTSPVKIPLSVYDLVTTKPIYESVDTNDVVSLLSLVGMRAISIFGLTQGDATDESLLSKLGDGKDVGKAEAINFASQYTLSKDVKDKLAGLSGNINSIIEMMKGVETDSIKKPFPWVNDPKKPQGIINKDGQVIIGSKDGLYDYAIPVTNLSWSKINSDYKSNGHDAAYRSIDYVDTKSYSINQPKQNLFTLEMNVNRVGGIVENQVTGVEGLNNFREKLLDEAKFSGDKYSKYFNDGDSFIAYIIENADQIDNKKKGSSYIPSSPNLVKDDVLYFTGFFDDGYNMNKLADVNTGFLYKDGSDVKRKKENGFNDYVNVANGNEFNITEFPGITTSYEPRKDTSIFGCPIYYRETDIHVKALMFLAGLGEFIEYEKIIDDIADDTVHIMNVPLVGIVFIGGILWAFNSNDNLNKFNQKIKVNSVISKYYQKLKHIHKTVDVNKALIKYFTTWVNGNITWADSTEVKPFKSWYGGMEIKIKDGSNVADFLATVGNLEDGADWLPDSSKINGDGKKSLMKFFKDHFTENFFRNYITVDEDKGARTNKYNHNGMRLGNRDGGPSVVPAVSFVLAGCTFVKNNKFFTRYKNDDNASAKDTKVKVSISQLTNFFEGFVTEILGDHVVGKETTDSNAAQGADDTTKSNDDIKVGIYRYCKLIYDRWIGGLSDERFEKNYTQHAFFDDPDKYFIFIDTFYIMANNAFMNVEYFKDNILNGFFSEEYSLLSFLQDQYGHNKFYMTCISNFYDINDVSNIKKMFDLIPYTGNWQVKEHPNFVVMFSDEPSAHLDINGSDYPDDSFLLSDNSSNGMSKWPEPLKSHNASMYASYKIPAFGVSYGKLYQSYFTDIDVSMDNPMITEQSAHIQMAICSELKDDAKDGEGNSGDRQEMEFYGQDLYSVYSNHSYTCTVTMLGCTFVQPLMYFCLNNIPMFRGTYIIKKVQHSMSPGNMVTKFTGVRMARTSTRLVSEYGIRKGTNDNGVGGVGGSDIENMISNENKVASVENDCEYKVFPLSGGYSGGVGGGIPESFLNMSWGELKKKCPGWIQSSCSGDKPSAFIQRNDITVKQALVAAIGAEYQGFTQNDNLMLKVASAMVCNKYHYCNALKESKTKWIYLIGTCQQGTGNHAATEKTYEKVKDIVEPILINGPQSLVGLTAYAQKGCNVTMWNRSVSGGTSPDSHVITTDDMQRVFMYCTQVGYDYQRLHSKFPKQTRAEDTHVPSNPNSYWKKADFLFHEYNTIFTSSCDQPGRKFWEATETTKLAKNNDGHVDAIIEGFINAVDKTSKSSGVNVGIGYDPNKSSGNTVYITNADKSDKFGMIFDILLNAYSDKLDEIKWIVPGNSQAQVPAGFICKVNESSNSTNIYVVDTNGTEQSIAIGDGGMHEHFCKAIVKKFKTCSETLIKSVHNFPSGSCTDLFSKYDLKPCANALNDAGLAPSYGVGGTENEKGYIGDWNVGLFVQKLHWWCSNVCEKREKGAPKQRKAPGAPTKGCGWCTSAVNRALRDSGLGNKYWHERPWGVCELMKKNDSKFVEVTGGTSSNTTEFNFGSVPLQKGDICTMWRTSNRDVGQYHTCAYDGSGWYSDFKQMTCNVYRSVKPTFNLEWHLFRYKGDLNEG